MWTRAWLSVKVARPMKTSRSTSPLPLTRSRRRRWPKYGERGSTSMVSQFGARERHLLQALHLRDQRGHVLEPRLADLVAQGEELLIFGDAPPLGAPGRRRPQALEHAREQALLLARNRVFGLLVGAGHSGQL